MNCVLYARVSTDKQADKDLSIPAQLSAMREFAHNQGWTVVQEFLEPGASARTAERPALRDLLALCKSAVPHIDVVLVHKIDRFARNVYDYATIRALLKQQGTRLASVVENTDDSVSGELVENIMASIAQFYSANLGQEARKGMRQKVLNGGWPHKPPRGYISVRNENGRGSRLVLDRNDSSLIRHAFELYATGHYSVKVLAQRLASDGLTARSGRPIAVAYLRRVLANPFYMGRIRWGDLDVIGTQPALISEELFRKVQGIIAERHRNAGAKSILPGFPMRGVAICAVCRSRMSAERHGHLGYYRCGRNAYRGALCPASLCNAKRAHQDLERLCQQIRITQPTVAMIIEAADRMIKIRVAEAADHKRQLEEELSILLRTEQELTREFTKGDLSPNTYRHKSGTLRDRRNAIGHELTRLPLDAQRLTARVTEITQVATSLKDFYDMFTDARRAELVKQVFGAIVLSRDGIAGFTLKPPFDAITAAAASDPRKLTKDERTAVASAILDAA